MLSKKGFIIKKSDIDDEKIKWLKNELTVSPETTFNQNFNNNLDSFPVFRESKSRFRIPRFFGYEHFPLKYKNNISS